MPEDGPTRISLELNGADGPIAGRLTDGTHEVPFRGWLALAAALEAARQSQRPTALERKQIHITPKGG